MPFDRELTLDQKIEYVNVRREMGRAVIKELEGKTVQLCKMIKEGQKALGELNTALALANTKQVQFEKTCDVAIECLKRGLNFDTFEEAELFLQSEER